VKQNNGVSGSVLVVGAGISGMQSALDLAESGFRVYLAEEKPAIGGTMVRLDKTFPTNDCAMCIVSPKLVDTGRHLNIEILTDTSLVSLQGEAGNFRAILKRKARYVDLAKCTGCGECARVCPVEVASEFDAGLGSRKAIYKLFPQATPGAYAIDKRGISPCRAACPAGVNVQGYVQLIKVGKYTEAWQTIYRDNPFPAVCGRVCTHPCQSACHRAGVDGAVNIRALKRFAADQVYRNLDALPLPGVEEPRGKRVAVVGAGPAGLSAAYQLVKKGYGVTVFEALPVAGGMMRVGIPEYRLPKKWVDLEVELLARLGVEFKFNTRLGKDITLEGLRQDYEAVFLAVGAHKSTTPGVPGEDLAGVEQGISFLRRVALGEPVTVGRRVAVIGGGNTAMDCARTAVRLGAGEVYIVYRRSEAEITALPEEIAAAKEEGIRFVMLTSPVRFIGDDGRLVGMECVKNRLEQARDGGRPRPVPLEGSEFILEADMVILATGQQPDLSCLKESIPAGNTIPADPHTLATGIPGVFAGGDCVTGPKTVIDAIAAGKVAAESIHRYLSGQDLKEGRQFRVSEEKIAPLRQAPHEIPRCEPRPEVHLDPQERVKGFVEEARTYTAEEAKKEAERCLNCAVCSECQECVRACLARAIDHEMQDEELELNVGAVILSPGGEIIEPAALAYYGYGRYPNVVTSIQFERILSASGPYQGHLVRPSDGKEPRRIAWIQCVGSRNLRLGHDYCSSVCCMYAIKEAVIAREHSHGPLETTIFFMDMRTYGKDFERYYRRAEEEHGVRFVRSRIYNVEEADNGNLRIRYVLPGGQVQEEEFDLVVLSVGFTAGEKARELASRLGVETDSFGFCRFNEFSPGVTSVPGIFAGGVFAGPKDIPETVTEASAAAGCVSRLLSAARGSETRVKEYPPERPVHKQPPRVGVFVCHCGINIGSVVRVPEVVEYAKRLPGVVYAREFLFTCSQDSVEEIKKCIHEHRLNRVVVASCTPRTHAPLFQGVMREAGLNPYLYEHVNIREHSSWVHRDRPEEATEKARDLVRMAVARVRLLAPIAQTYTGINKSALVVGGGVAGMTAALSLAEQGFAVSLVEKGAVLGGNARHLYYTLQGSDPQQFLAGLVEKVTGHPQIQVYTGSEVVEAGGYPGNYHSRIRTPEKEVEINHGAVVLATGAREARPREYLLGQHDRVMTQRELEERIYRGEVEGLNTVVMIQCVGSRDDERPYCSRICCSHALKNALKLKEKNPRVNIYVLYRDIRVYGLNEQYYTQARQKGIIFIRYDREKKPVVEAAGGGLVVRVVDPILGVELAVEPDALVLSTGVEPGEDNGKLSQLFKVPLNSDGFFLEAHMKLRPVDFAAEGLYLCGLAHSPKLVGESITQANAAAMRAVTLLARDRLANVAITATVNPRRCVGCGVCVQVCDYQARSIDPLRRVAEVNEALCQGCGACVAACPNGASQQKGYEKAQLLAMLEAALEAV
jgi:heterodisulfide reductase subunit A-like polyferredoxin